MAGLDLTPRDGFHVPSVSFGEADDALVLLVGPRLLSQTSADACEVAGYYETLALFSDFAGDEDVISHCKELADDSSARVVLIGMLPVSLAGGVAEQAFAVANLPAELISDRSILVGIEDTALIAVVAAATHPDAFTAVLAVHPDRDVESTVDGLVEGMSTPAQVIRSDARRSGPFPCAPAAVSDVASLLRASSPGRTGTALRTMLFTDIVDSTRRAAAMGDHDWATLLHEHHHLASQTVGRFGGSVIDTAGDGMLAIFDRPELGIRCGLHMTREVATILALQLRAGLHAGVVELDDDGISGIAVHIAARVQAAAEPGTVWLSASLLPLIEQSGYRLVDRGEHVLKGVEGTRRLMEVSAP
jgi:class 3 adenylate cyclase